MQVFLVCLFLFWLVNGAAACLVGREVLRRLLKVLLPVVFALSLIVLAPHLVPYQRLVLTTAAMLYVLKGFLLLGRSRHDLSTFSAGGLAIYLTIWPGLNPDPFRARTQTDEDGVRFVRGLIFAGAGLALAVAVALGTPYLGADAAGWAGILSLLLIIHFGYAEILTCLLRLAGWNVQPLFQEPLKSKSLREFWSRRWNLAFVEMNRLLFLGPLSRNFGVRKGLFAVFLVSGLLHELAISYAALGAWGGPLLYFCLQGVVYLAEERIMRLAPMNEIAKRMWVFALVVLPLPLLFTAPFRKTLVVPFFLGLHQGLTAHDLRWWFGLALSCATVGNLVTLAAGAQIPWRLNWRSELSRLSSFNRKIILNYYAYVGLMILTWAVLTVLLRQELINGDRAAICLAAVMGSFWGMRVLVDLFFFSHKDWPPGASMTIGHACLTTLFCLLTATYIGLVIWHAEALLIVPAASGR